jgi:hypothetical protein
MSFTVQSGDTVAVPLDVLYTVTGSQPPVTLAIGPRITLVRQWLNSAPHPPIITAHTDLFEDNGNDLGHEDTGGYVWVGDQAIAAWGKTAFAWTPGTTAITDLTAPQAIGFNFPFYGQVFSSVRISKNGYLTFGGPTDAFYTSGFPDPNLAGGIIAPLLHELVAGSVLVRRDPDRLIVEWRSWEPIDTGPEIDNSDLTPTQPPPFTFEAILKADGDILFQYLSSPEPLTNYPAGIGIQPASGAGGIGVPLALHPVGGSTGGQPGSPGSIVRFTPRFEWLRAWTPTDTRVTQGGSFL